VQICDEIIAIIFAAVLQFSGVFEHAQIIADVQSARGLDTGDKDWFHIILIISCMKNSRICGNFSRFLSLQEVSPFDCAQDKSVCVYISITTGKIMGRRLVLL